MNRLTWWKNLLNNCYFFLVSSFWPIGYIFWLHVRNANWSATMNLSWKYQILWALAKRISQANWIPSKWMDWLKRKRHDDFVQRRYSFVCQHEVSFGRNRVRFVTVNQRVSVLVSEFQGDSFFRRSLFDYTFSWAILHDNNFGVVIF